MQIERVSVDSLVFDPVNARKHSERNISAIKGSLAKFGQQKPLVVDANNVVIAGNGTLEAAKDLGWKEVDIHRTPLAGAEAIAFALADNKTAELATWDDDILSEHLAALYKDGWDIEDIGFDASDLEIDLGTTGKTDDDEVPEVEENIHGVERGQIWQLGEHRLMCGDSTSKDDFEKLMAGEKADMVFTDPPYGIDEQTNRAFTARSRKAKGKTFKPIEGDKSTDCARSAVEVIKDISPSVAVIWGSNYWAHSLPETGNWLVWDKREDDKERDFNSDFELAWVKSKATIPRIFRHKWKGMIKASEHGEGRVHPTQKPIALAEWCFEQYKAGNKILDLFLGSGSTLIACEKTGRKCYGMEIDPHYVSVIIERWQNFTGQTANLVKRG